MTENGDLASTEALMGYWDRKARENASFYKTVGDGAQFCFVQATKG